MAIAYGDARHISRTNGRSAVAAAAYRSGSRLVDARTGQTHDYRRKRGVAHTEIVAPEGCAWASDRQVLWDAAERAENRSNSMVAREWLGALPHEVSDDGRLAISRGMADYIMQRHGVAVDFAIHAPDRKPITGDEEVGRNWHVHMMLTTRRANAEGLAEKTRELHPPHASEQITAWRKAWETIVNAQLEAEGRPERICMDSYQKQGVAKVGLPKVGPVASAMERRGIQSDAGNQVRHVADLNRRRRAAGRKLVAELKQVEGEIMKLERQQREYAENPWKGQKIPMMGGGGPVDKGKARKRWEPRTDKKQQFKADKISERYDSDLGHLAPQVRQFKEVGSEFHIQLVDYSWILDREATDGRVYLHGKVTDESINAWADVCAAKGWTRMEIEGNEAFKARAWLELKSRGIEVTNYEPAPHIRQKWEEMTAGGGPSDPPALPAPDWLEEAHDEEGEPRPQHIPPSELLPTLSVPKV